MLEALLQGLPGSMATFAVATAVICVLGFAMATTADRLADRTGWGEAVVGGIFLAGATSLPDLTATLTAAVDDRPDLAMSNVMGSMAANLAFLGVGDLVYRRANLEHAAASSANLTQAALSIALLAIPLLAVVGPEVDVLGVHPVTLVVPVAYGFGFSLVRHAHARPMWTPRRTPETIEDRPDPDTNGRRSVARLWLRFAVLAVLVGAAGWVLMKSAESLAALTALSDTAVGGVFTAVATSSPELVTTIAAVRRGALTLAVGSVLGTNCFNTTIIAAADVAYRDGSIYHAVTEQQALWGLLAILMTATLLLGFVRRQTYGIANIGFESVLILLVYVGAIVVVLGFGS